MPNVPPEQFEWLEKCLGRKYGRRWLRTSLQAMTATILSAWPSSLQGLAAKALLEALRAYQAANPIHNDSESALHEQGEAAIALAEEEA